MCHVNNAQQHAPRHGRTPAVQLCRLCMCPPDQRGLPPSLQPAVVEEDAPTLLPPFANAENIALNANVEVRACGWWGTAKRTNAPAPSALTPARPALFATPQVLKKKLANIDATIEKESDSINVMSEHLKNVQSELKFTSTRVSQAVSGRRGGSRGGGKIWLGRGTQRMARPAAAGGGGWWLPREADNGQRQGTTGALLPLHPFTTPSFLLSRCHSAVAVAGGVQEQGD